MRTAEKVGYIWSKGLRCLLRSGASTGTETRLSAEESRELKRKLAARKSKKELLPKPVRRVERAIREAGANYSPPFYPGGAVFFKAQRSRAVLDWHGWVEGRFDVIEIPGGHNAMFRRQIPVLAKEVTRVLADAHAGKYNVGIGLEAT
jgi:hypothetical protein